jgi:hypothetical protein
MLFTRSYNRQLRYTRSTTIKLAAAATLVLITGCASRNEPLRFNDTATMLSVFDPRAGKQLTKGFFPIEGPGRWTGRTFSVVLKPPPTAVTKGAILLLRAGIPGPSIDLLHSIRVSAVVNGVALAPEEYVKAGEFEYIRDVPASAFRGDHTTVDFTLDKVLPPAGSERRELGVVMNTVGFEAK